jgi:hypothetical protein
MYQPDGIRVRLASNHPHGKFVDRTRVSDIKSISCRKLKIEGHDAYLQNLLSTAHYKFDPASNCWKFINIQ